MIHPLLPMHQMPTPKTPSPQIHHPQNLKKAALKASLFYINTLCNLSDHCSDAMRIASNGVADVSHSSPYWHRAELSVLLNAVRYGAY
jgi:hypothetical protein